MCDKDVLVWEQFLPCAAASGWEWYYDVPVGRVQPLGGEVPSEWQAHWARLRMKRVDALGRRPGEICVVEVKPHFDAAALGQLAVYLRCVRQDVVPQMTVHGWGVCLTCDTDVLSLAAESGWLIWGRVDGPEIFACGGFEGA